MNPETQAALRAEWRASLPRVLTGEDERFWPTSFERCEVPSKPITGRAVILAVAEASGVSIEQLTGTTRSQPIATYRMMAYSLVSELTGQSSAMIGRLFKRCHGAVLHGIARYASLKAGSPDVAEIETRARAIIGGGG